MNKTKYFAIVMLLITTSIFGWGRHGHIIITGQAFDLLKTKMNLTDLYKDSVVAKSNDPDKRVRTIKYQAPWHYIDIDFYKEYNELRMVENYDSLLTLYPDSVIKANGTLPWVIERTFNSLITAFKSNNLDSILFYSADLAHFVGDAHMPLHTTINYDGQLTDQKGIHSRYESKMVNKYLEEIKAGFFNQEVKPIENPLNTAFYLINGSFSLIDQILTADKKAKEFAYSYDTDMYIKLLWKQTEYVTYMQMNSAAKYVASYIYTAWEKAGSPKINTLIN